MNREKPSVPERVARELAKNGVKAAFGVPGGEGSSELIQALARNGVRFVLCHTESQAAFMATAKAEVSGGVGVVLTSLGPGAASAVNGAAHALLDRVPLLLITDRFGQEQGPACGHQFIDQAALYAPVTKRSMRLERAGPSSIIQAAITEALKQPRGPVHIDFPANLAHGEALPGAAGHAAATDPETATPPATSETDAEPTSLKAVSEALSRASRPVVIGGLGLVAAKNRPHLARLVSRLKAPLLTTYKAIGAARGAPHWNGGVFTGGALESDLLEQADLILTVGFDAVEMIPTEWRWKAPVYSLTEDPTPCPVSKPVQVALGPLATTLPRLTGALEKTSGASTWTEREVEAMREENHARVLASWPAPGINPTAAVQQAAKLFPEATFSVDAGAHMFAATLALNYMSANRCSISNGLATMGYALPAAIGATYAEPERTAIAITGDGGLSMCLAELETAVRSGNRIVVLLMNDAQLSLIKIKQEARGHAPEGVAYGATDWPRIAAAYGARSRRANSDGELTAALEEAATRTSGVDLIEVALAPGGYGHLMETVRGASARPQPAT